MWPKFGNSSIFMTEVVTTSILQGFDQNSCFFEGWSWFKFNNLGLTWYKLEITGEKLVGGLFVPPILNRVKTKLFVKIFFSREFLLASFVCESEKIPSCKDYFHWRIILQENKTIKRHSESYHFSYNSLNKVFRNNYHSFPFNRSIDHFFDSLIYSRSQDIIKVIVSEAIIWL